jgi:hypothetical protein
MEASRGARKLKSGARTAEPTLSANPALVKQSREGRVFQFEGDAPHPHLRSSQLPRPVTFF